MSDLRKISIVVSFFSLWLSSFLNTHFQQVIGFSLILSFGILHGANDIDLLRLVSNHLKYQKKVIVVCYYIVFIGIITLFFYLLPFFALLFFIYISAIHFGEQHWNYWEPFKLKTLKKIFEHTYGLFLLFLLFYCHYTDVAVIIKEITGYYLNVSYFKWSLIIISTCLVSFFIFFWLKDSFFKSIALNEMVYLSVFIILFNVSSLVWSFMIYFIIWHSVPSILDQIEFEYKKVTFAHFLSYCKKAFLYWFMALISLFFFYYYYNAEKYFFAVFFTFLASITFPHFLVILQMFKNKNKML